MDRAPYLLDGSRWGYRMGPAEIHDSMLRDGLDDAFSGRHSGWHTEDLVSQFDITQETQDRWAARSQQRFSDAQGRGEFDAEVVAVDIPSRKASASSSRAMSSRARTRPWTRLRACVRHSARTARSPRAMRRD